MKPKAFPNNATSQGGHQEGQQKEKHERKRGLNPEPWFLLGGTKHGVVVAADRLDSINAWQEGCCVVEGLDASWDTR